MSLIKREYDARIIDCALPFMSKHRLSHAVIAYHYRNTSVAFDTASSELTAHLRRCAVPEGGPQVSFDGKIDIWPANAS